MSNINIDLLVQDRSWKSQKEINKQLMEDIFKLVLNYLKIPMCENTVEISVTLTNDENIRTLNKNYRHRDRPTNVLTFSLYEKKSDVVNDIRKMPFMALGDIIFSYDTIEKESREQHKTFKNHFIHMLIHSYLHLFSYDHIEKREQKEMENIEIEILKSLNIDNPYTITELS